MLVPIVLVGDCDDGDDDHFRTRRSHIQPWSKVNSQDQAGWSRLFWLVIAQAFLHLPRPAPDPKLPIENWIDVTHSPPENSFDCHWSSTPELNQNKPFQIVYDTNWNGDKWLRREEARHLRPLSEQMLPPPGSVYPVSQADGGTMAAPPD